MKIIRQSQVVQLTSVFTFMLAVTLLLGAPALASAQVSPVTAAPIAFKNSTPVTLVIEAESILDRQGMERDVKLVWKLKPGEYSYLTDQDDNRIQATRFSYKVKTTGKTSRWICRSNGPLANGTFTVEFTADNLRSHLGHVVVKQGGLGRVAKAGPSKEAIARAVLKAVGALVLHDNSKPQADDGILEALARELARKGRDELISSALEDLFPRSAAAERTAVLNLVVLAFDGKMPRNRDKVLARLRRINPDMAEAAEMAEFLIKLAQAVDNARP
jgi:hypothetical protein